jgi:hypothetical protein
MNSCIEFSGITGHLLVNSLHMYHLHKNPYFHSPFLKTSISIVNKISCCGVMIIKT